MKILFEISIKDDDGKQKTVHIKKEKRKLSASARKIQRQLKMLSEILTDDEIQPDKISIINTVSPLIETLNENEGLDKGLFDILPTQVRKSILMLFWHTC